MRPVGPDNLKPLDHHGELRSADPFPRSNRHIAAPRHMREDARRRERRMPVMISRLRMTIVRQRRERDALEDKLRVAASAHSDRRDRGAHAGLAVRAHDDGIAGIAKNGTGRSVGRDDLDAGARLGRDHDLGRLDARTRGNVAEHEKAPRDTENPRRRTISFREPLPDHDTLLCWRRPGRPEPDGPDARPRMLRYASGDLDGRSGEPRPDRVERRAGRHGLEPPRGRGIALRLAV